MANEAVCYETPTRFARYTVSDETPIAKGALLSLFTPNSATTCSADDDVFGGIAWMEKVASDGTTEVSAALNGVWGMVLGTTVGGATIGEDLSIETTNTVTQYTTLDNEAGFVVGKALETYGTAGGVIKVRVNL